MRVVETTDMAKDINSRRFRIFDSNPEIEPLEIMNLSDIPPIGLAYMPGSPLTCHTRSVKQLSETLWEVVIEYK